MKKSILMIAFAFLAAGAFAQGSVITNYFDKYADNDNFTKVSVSSKMFSMFTEMEPGSEAQKEFMEAVSKLKGLKIVMADSISNARDLYKKAAADVRKAGYDELMTVDDPDQSMLFSIKEKDGKINELIMVVGGKKNFVLLSLYGEIDLKNISKIAQDMKVEGLENLGRMHHE
ncbi:MAG: DUF4252 domain-containing protein [Bacteroidales bacterium]|jgi:hypothetical protein